MPLKRVEPELIGKITLRDGTCVRVNRFYPTGEFEKPAVNEFVLVVDGEGEPPEGFPTLDLYDFFGDGGQLLGHLEGTWMGDRDLARWSNDEIRHVIQVLDTNLVTKTKADCYLQESDTPCQIGEVTQKQFDEYQNSGLRVVFMPAPDMDEMPRETRALVEKKDWPGLERRALRILADIYHTETDL